MQIQLKISEREIVAIVANHINSSKVLGDKTIKAEDLQWKYTHDYDETSVDGLQVDLPMQ